MELGKYKLDSSTVIENTSVEKSKASSEETPSCGDATSLKSSEGKDTNSAEPIDDPHNEERAQSELQINEIISVNPPALFLPVPRISAFTTFTPVDEGDNMRTSDTPSVQDSNPDLGKLLQGAYGELLVPQLCGHGCCEMKSDVTPVSWSLLGPEFIDYCTDSSTFTSHELAALAVDISNVAWSRIGVDSSSIQAMDNATSELLCSSNQQVRHLEDPSCNNVAKGDLFGMIPDAISGSMSRQPQLT